MLPVRWSDMEISRNYVACALWVVAVALLVSGTFDYSRTHDPALFAWGLFVAIDALVITLWSLIERACRPQDISVERISTIIDRLDEARNEVTRLR